MRKLRLRKFDTYHLKDLRVELKKNHHPFSKLKYTESELQKLTQISPREFTF